MTRLANILTVRIGVILLPKRGRQTLVPLYVKNVRRPDRTALVTELNGDGRLRQVSVKELARDYNVDAASYAAVMKVAKRALKMKRVKS